jgi:hypothetical protein
VFYRPKLAIRDRFSIFNSQQDRQLIFNPKEVNYEKDNLVGMFD